ncbi:MAG: hypothetical protein WD851_04780 [Pirellulales bacterium]
MNRTSQQYTRGKPLAVWAGVSAILLALLIGGVWWLTRLQYPEVTSAESLNLVRALYTACSSQNPQRLDKVEQKVAQTHQTGNLTQSELASFQSIIAQARDGRWEEAAQSSYQFAEDQVR